MKAKKRNGSVFSVLLVIVLLLVVATTVAANVIFSTNGIPKIGNYYFYTHETNDMEPDIHQNTLVLAKASTADSLSPGNKVLCYLSDNTLALRALYNITVNEDGSTNYFPGTALEQGNELAIPRTNIFAICTWQSKELYSYVKFATSVAGIMVLLIIPALILIVMFLVKIARSSSHEVDEEDFLFDEEPEMPKKKKTGANPLFEPGQVPAADASLEKKKSSISEHFEKKTVDEDSPYQRAVQERTMRFRSITPEQAEEVQRQQAAKAAAGGTQVFSTQTVEETARMQQAAAEQPTSAAPAAPVQPPMPEEPIQRTETPNIDDIVRPSELRAAKAGQKINPEIAATDSIDELLRVLEAEKKKLS